MEVTEQEVVKYLALGVPLANVCDFFSLPLPEWKEITEGSIFQTAITEKKKDIVSGAFSSGELNPALTKMAFLQGQAVEALEDRLNDVENPATQLKAATYILDKTIPPTEEEKLGEVTLTITASKMKTLMAGEDE